MTGPFPPQELPDSPYGGRGPLLMGVTWSLAIVAMTLIGLRTYANVVIVKKSGWDYVWAMITLLTSITGQSLHTFATHSGLCNHNYFLTPAQTVAAMKWAWMGQIVILNAIGFGKVAICAFLLRIRDGTHTKGKWFLYFVAISGLIININSTVMMLVQCTPAAKHWDPSLPGTCNHVRRTERVGYFQGSWAAASDVALALYPLIAFRKLQVSRKIWIAMIILFGGGIVAGAASAIKTVHIKLIGLSTDPTYGVFDLVLWGLVECWLVLILGCLPSLRALFMRTADQVRAFISRPSRATSGYRRSKTEHVLDMYPENKRSASARRQDSGEYILPNGDKIMKTTEIRVSRVVGTKRDDSGKRNNTFINSPV